MEIDSFDAKKTQLKERSIFELVLYYGAIILKYKKLVLILTFSFSILTFILLLVTKYLPLEINPLPTLYTSNATLLIKQEESVMSPLISQMGLDNSRSSYSDPNDETGNLIMRVLESRNLLDKVIEKFDVFEKYKIDESEINVARRILLNYTSVGYNRTTKVLMLTYSDTDRYFARDILNGMIEFLDEWFSSKFVTSKTRNIGILEEKLAKVSADISELERKVMEFQKKYGVLSVEELSSFQGDALKSLHSQLVLKEIEIKKYSKFSNPNDPMMIRLKSERSSIVDLIKEVESGWVNAEDTEIETKNLPEIALEFSHLSSNLEIQRRIFETLSQQYEVAKLSLENEPMFQVLDLPEIAEKGDKPNRTMLFMGSLFVGFLISIALALLLNAIKKIKKAEKHSI